MNDSLTCPQCNNSIPCDSEFCPYCGSKISLHKDNAHEENSNYTFEDEIQNNNTYVKETNTQPTPPKKSKKVKIICLSIVSVLLLLTLALIIFLPRYKYRYILRNYNNDNLTTYKYLTELKKRNYKDSDEIYERLYAWEITVTPLNTQTNFITKDRTIDIHKPVYFRLELSGGEPNKSVRISVISTLPNGHTESYIFEEAFTDGDSFQFGWTDGIYADPETGQAGTLKCNFYDEANNLIGTGSVKITKSQSSLFSNNSNTTTTTNNSNTTTTTYTCLSISCNNPVNSFGQYCAEHKCLNATCKSAKSYNSNYCSSCQCSAAGCKNAKSSTGHYCYEHKCAKSGCSFQKAYGKNYCYLHS